MKIILPVLLCAPILWAQEPAVPGVVPPRPGQPADAPPAVVARGLTDPDLIQTPAGGRWELLNSNGQDIALLYATLTGKRVLVSSTAAQAELSLIQPGPLTNRQASNILEKQLLMEGFALIPSGDNEVKLVLAQGQNASAKTENTRVISSLDEINESTDEFITYVMALEYLKPDEALRAFQQVVGQFGPAGSVAAVPNAASVVISGNSPLIRMMVELKNRIDVPSARVDKKFVPVEYADVEELAERLNEIFNQQTQQGQTAAVQRTPQTPNAAAVAIPGIGGATSSAAGEETPINILPDSRTNRIFLMGRPVDIVFVESLIREFDTPSSSRNFLRRKLRYLPVAEFLGVAADALERTISGTAAGGGAAGSRSTGRTSTTGRTTGGTTGGRTTGGTTGGATGGATGTRAQLSQSEVQTAPESVLVGKTLLVADNISNSIVVQGPPHHVEIIDLLIEELDQPSEQVAITAVFARYDIGDNRNFGIDLAHTLQQASGDLALAGSLRNGVPSVLDPATLLDLNTVLGAAGAAGNGFSLYGLIGDDFGFFVNALESNSNFRAISRPTVFTTNNNAARISSGSRIAVPTSTFQGTGTSGFSTNVEFRDIVLELEVRPLVNSADEVTLEIALVRDNTGEDRQIEGFGAVPDIDTDEISTIVTVPNRATIILGGLITETDRDSKTGVPILSAIPGIGNLFSRTTKEVTREELVILIHPSIISNGAQLDGFQRDYDSGSEIAPRARSSVHTGVLPSKGSVAVPVPYSDKGQPAYRPPAYQQAAAPAPGPQPVPTAQPARASSIVTSPFHQGIKDKKMRLNYNRRR